MTWHTAHAPPGPLEAYVHLIRAEDDPQRRGATMGKGRGWESMPHLKVNKEPPEHWARVLLEHFRDGETRTWNRACVELFEKTADVLFETSIDAALWHLVERGDLEHTAEAPILFRITARGRQGPGGQLGLFE